MAEVEGSDHCPVGVDFIRTKAAPGPP